MVGVTHETIQLLLDQRTRGGMIVSCYADTGEAAAVRSPWSRHLRIEARAIEQRLTGGARGRFNTDVQIIREALSGPSPERGRGVAVFSDAGHGLFRVFHLGVRVSDRLVFAREPYVVPLLQALHRHRRYLVVVTDSQRSRLYEAAWGHTVLLQEMEGDVPRRQRSAGETWGKQQATIARHREDCLLHYRKDLVRRIERAWPTSSYRGLILLGNPATIAALRDEDLPSWLAGRIVHVGAYDWPNGEPAVDAVVRSVLDDALRAHDVQLTEEFERRFREGHYVAAGPREVLQALHNGQVAHPGYLLLEPDRGTMASRCEQCGYMSTSIRTRCPVCRGMCDEVNLWQEILLFAARHNIIAHTLERNDCLAARGGIGAVLSRSEPWAAAAPSAAAAG